MKNKQTIYMDYQASTPLRENVLEAMLPYLTHDYANPHSADHVMGWNSSKAIDLARQNVAEIIGAEVDEVIFTSGATESNNQAIISIARAIRSNKKKILIGATEHKCVIESARFACLEYGLVLETIPVDREGFIDIDAYKSLLDHDVGLVSIMMVNNEVGTIQNLKKLADLAKEYGAIFHSDAAQSLVAVDVDVYELGVDLMSISAHKIYGPKGVGALYISRNITASISPLLHGGAQQNGLRAGTLPTAQCVGFGVACKSLTNMDLEREGIRNLKKTFLSTLSKLVEIEINGPIDLSKCHPGNINLYFRSMDANTLLMKIQPELCASSGSACNSGFIESSYVIRALGHTQERAENSIRFSIGNQTTKAEVLAAVNIISKALLET